MSPASDTISANAKPQLSLVVVVYRMARQAMNTLYSLSTAYQRNVAESDYEIIVVENASDDMLDPQAIAALGSNIRYIRRTESGVSPAAAINAGFAQVRSDYAGLMIDGARLTTPRVIATALQARRLSAQSLLAIPTFNLGTLPQHLQSGYSSEAEQALLAQVNWRDNGYRLFDIGSIGEANPRGVFQPFMESNCYFTALDNFRAIGFADEAFQFPGGGGLNLHMFRALGMLPDCHHYMIAAGEGTFHQFHGGVSTSQREDRETSLLAPRAQLESYWGNRPFQALEREPLLIGAVTSHAQKFLHYSSQRARKRFDRLHGQGENFWRDDLAFAHSTDQGDGQ